MDVGFDQALDKVVATAHFPSLPQMMDQIVPVIIGISLQSVDAEKEHYRPISMAQNQISNHRKRERYNSCKVQPVNYRSQHADPCGVLANALLAIHNRPVMQMGISTAKMLARKC